MYSSFRLLNIILGHLCVPILLAKMLIWAPFLQSMCTFQGFIQTLLMSGRRHEKLNLVIKFWNLIFMKFYFEVYQNKLASSLYSK